MNGRDRWQEAVPSFVTRQYDISFAICVWPRRGTGATKKTSRTPKIIAFLFPSRSHQPQGSPGTCFFLILAKLPTRRSLGRPEGLSASPSASDILAKPHAEPPKPLGLSHGPSRETSLRRMYLIRKIQSSRRGSSRAPSRRGSRVFGMPLGEQVGSRSMSLSL